MQKLLRGPREGSTYAWNFREVQLVIIIDESRLTFGTIAKIGEECGIKYDYENYEPETYEAYIQSIVEKYKFDVELLQEKIIDIFRNGIKMRFSLD